MTPGWTPVEERVDQKHGRKKTPDPFEIKVRMSSCATGAPVLF